MNNVVLNIVVLSCPVVFKCVVNVVVCCVVFNGFVVAFRYNGAVKLNGVVFGRKVVVVVDSAPEICELLVLDCVTFFTASDVKVEFRSVIVVLNGVTVV